MQQKTEKLQEIARSTGLEVKISKTKFRINSRPRKVIHIEGQAIEEFDRFTYLGSIVSKTGGAEEDIKARIGKAHHTFVTLRPVWNNRNIYWKTKIRLFNTNVKIVLLYGAETWKRTRRLDQSLEVFMNKCFRQILRKAREVFKPGHISNNRAASGYELHTIEEVEMDRTHAAKNPAQHSKASPGLEPSRTKKKR
ncbi:uncharacterized protein LOC127837240 [Dreissena polymorpha]|uniref:uncharacterized protein LOC127837240 n=1 Tax=Dreissena polymorpha TaxID=45954 RepID=UPI002263EF91|nr:uncharacterized protein LOC127837240 [Dreissena polymorpha]